MTDFLASPSEQPLSYYEEKSYMLAIPWSDQEDTLFDREEKIRRISRMEGVEVLSVASENDGEQPFITISYHGETYAVDLSPYPAYDSLQIKYSADTYFLMKKMKNWQRLNSA